MATAALSIPAPEAQESAICIDEAKWGAGLMRYRQAHYRAKTEYGAYVALPKGHPDRQILSDLSEQSGTEESAAEDALMEIPAPHLAALRWKLDHVLTFHDGEDGDRFMDAYSIEWVQQTIADYKRLLPETV
jgi:hypothetical protein